MVEQWLEHFAQAVRSRDFEAGRAMFDAAVIGYGTRGLTMHGLDHLVGEQWSHIWPATRGFRFDATDATWSGGEVVAVAVRWSSEGHGVDGRWQLRRGRATLVLRRVGERLRCVHSHFSLDPISEALVPT